MTSLRTIAAAVALAAAAALPAPALAASTALRGDVVDGDSGLGVAGAKVAFSGAGAPTASATTDASGRYFITGLPDGLTGQVVVTGPAGWDGGGAGPITTPASGSLGVDDIEIRRDWASVPGGASASSNDETAGPAGCGSAKAVDGDPGTGWSASSARPASDPPVLTVALPATIDISRFALLADAVCGHAAAAALGGFRVETSPDGVSWSVALTGALTAADRGQRREFSPSAAASAVHYVRLVALSPQAAAATIDVRELEILGTPPNVLPSGTLDAPARVFVKQAVRLTANLTDPDSAIVRYAWDFDSNGTIDQVTRGPVVTHVWEGAGTPNVTVYARDWRGGSGSASTQLRVVDPSVPLEAIPQRKPVIAIDTPDGPSVLARVTCSSRCKVALDMRISRRMARRLHLRSVVLVKRGRTITAGALGNWELDLPQSVIKKLRRMKIRKLNVRINVSAVDQQMRRSRVSRPVVLK